MQTLEVPSSLTHFVRTIRLVDATTLQLGLREASDREPASVPAIQRAVRVALAAPVLPRVQDLALKVAMSERQLTRATSSALLESR